MERKMLSLMLVVMLGVPALLHGGRTDSNGGHYDHSTGEYHYHHGYGAHDHYDMDGDGYVDCPYDFDDQTDHNHDYSNGSNGTKDNDNYVERPDDHAEFEYPEMTFWDIVSNIFSTIICSCGVLLICWGSLFPLAFFIGLLPIVAIIEKITKTELSESANKFICKISFVIGIIISVIAVGAIAKHIWL